jgi:GAF domain-containing protein
MSFGEQASVAGKLAHSLETQEKAVEALAKLGQRLNEAEDADSVVKRLLPALLELTGARIGSVLFAPRGKSALEERLVLGATHDPLNEVPVKGVGSLAYVLFRRREARCIRNLESELLGGDSHRAIAGLGSALVIPLAARNLALGMLHLYRDEPTCGFERFHLDLARVAAENAYSCILAAMLARKLSLPAVG